MVCPTLRRSPWALRARVAGLRRCVQPADFWLPLGNLLTFENPQRGDRIFIWRSVDGALSFLSGEI